VYVQPIPPVLDVTRKLVIRYNELYREAIRGVKGEALALSPARECCRYASCHLPALGCTLVTLFAAIFHSP
jgi:hypothetical protein